MLVLVEQPAWATSEANMRLYLTQAIESLLTEKIGHKGRVFVPYHELGGSAEQIPPILRCCRREVGKARSHMVLYIVIDNFGLYGLSDAGYYRGQLDARSGLYDVASGQRLWPQSGELKSVFG